MERVVPSIMRSVDFAPLRTTLIARAAASITSAVATLLACAAAASSIRNTAISAAGTGALTTTSTDNITITMCAINGK